MLQCYRWIRLGLLAALMSFFGFLLWMFLEIQHDQSIAFFESDTLLGYLLISILIWYVLFEVFQNAKRTLMRMELVG